MATNRKRPSVDEWTADKWYREFFSMCLLPDSYAESYAVIFAQNGMRSDMLSMLDRDLLKEMKIDKVGHMIEILRVAQEISAQEQRSKISHPSRPTTQPPPSVQSKVISLKSVVTTKDSRQRKESEVGGAKRDTSNLKRPVPNEGPTLSVKMPCRMIIAPSASHEDESQSQSLVRSSIRDRPSAQSIEVSSSTEKRGKKSVFDRLGTANPSQSADQSAPAGGILKKAASNLTLPTTSVKYGPVELPKPIPSPGRKRLRSPGRLILNNSGIGSAKAVAVPGPTSFKQRSLSPGPSSKQTSVEPSFHVTMSMKLSNPLVTKVHNGHLNKKQQERKNISTNVVGIGRSNTSPQLGDMKHQYGSMAADQVEMSRDIGAEKALKQRLGSKGNFWSKYDSPIEKKRVSFGNVRTKEIPALPGTQPINPNPSILCKQIYSGSVALRTAKKL